MVCKHCGNTLADSSKFCPNCGKAVTGTPPPPPPALPVQPNKTPDLRQKRIFAVLLGWLCMGIVFFVTQRFVVSYFGVAATAAFAVVKPINNVITGFFVFFGILFALILHKMQERPRGILCSVTSVAYIAAELLFITVLLFAGLPLTRLFIRNAEELVPYCMLLLRTEAIGMLVSTLPAVFVGLLVKRKPLLLIGILDTVFVFLAIVCMLASHGLGINVIGFSIGLLQPIVCLLPVLGRYGRL